MWTANYDFKWNVGSQQHWKDLLFCSFPSPESKSSQPYSLFLVSVIRTVLTVRLGGGSNLMSLNLWVLPHKFKVKGRFPGGWNISSWQCPHQQTKNLGNIRSDTRRRIKRLLLVQEPVWALHNNARSFWQLCCLPYKAPHLSSQHLNHNEAFMNSCDLKLTVWDGIPTKTTPSGEKPLVSAHMGWKNRSPQWKVRGCLLELPLLHT